MLFKFIEGGMVCVECGKEVMKVNEVVMFFLRVREVDGGVG